jgi:hypothetical protein
MDDQARLHMTNSIVAPRTGGKLLDSTSFGTYWGDYNCWTTHSAQTNDHGFDILDIEPHSFVADPLFESNEGPQVRENSPVRGKAYVDNTFYPWLKRSGFVDPEHPPDKFPLMVPDLYPDIGCQIAH